jgi:hypothetical protein
VPIGDEQIIDFNVLRLREGSPRREALDKVYLDILRRDQ